MPRFTLFLVGGRGRNLSAKDIAEACLKSGLTHENGLLHNLSAYQEMGDGQSLVQVAGANKDPNCACYAEEGRSCDHDLAAAGLMPPT